MLVRCKPLCKMSDGTTDASLDVDSNEAICNECGETLSHVSKYSKLSMKTNGDILRTKNKKAFMFPCETCDKSVEAAIVDSRLVGRDCGDPDSTCRINVTKHMIQAIQETEKYLTKVDEHDRGE
tara:strand:- start:4053 stop:4424 length:372 start_codon:yes stop_codon:yes gene_type:complete